MLQDVDESASVRHTAMALFCCEYAAREIAFINASESALQLLKCIRVAALYVSVLPLGKLMAIPAPLS